MACKANEIQEAIDWDDYGIPIAFKCVAAVQSSANSSATSTWDKIMEAADKILKGAEIITGNKGSTPTRKKGDFGSDVIDRTTPNTGNNTGGNNGGNDGGTNWVLIGGIVLGVAFLLLLFKMFSARKPVAALPK